jgi:hypothetical protein
VVGLVSDFNIYWHNASTNYGGVSNLEVDILTVGNLEVDKKLYVAPPINVTYQEQILQIRYELHRRSREVLQCNKQPCVFYKEEFFITLYLYILLESLWCR